MRMFRKDEGFTLVELMVVVLIIGILVAIAIPVFNAASSSARERTCQSNMRTIEGAVEQYLAADPNNTRSECDDRAWAGVLIGADSYIKSEPYCPSGMVDGTNAVYTYDADTMEVSCTSDVDTHPHY